MARNYQRITDGFVEAIRDFKEGVVKTVWDLEVRGLHVRIGRNRITWTFQREHAIRGKRGVTFRRLGYFPEMKVSGARKAAMIEAGHVAGGNVIAGRRSAVKFGGALDDYIRRTKVRGKSESWSRNIESLKRTHLKDFLKWTLPELSAAPKVINDWHMRVSEDHGVFIANQAARVLRAVYNRARKLDHSLPGHNPVSAVEMNKEHRAVVAFAFKDFPKWFAAWNKIESPIRKAYQMIGLLTGARCGELSRLKWQDVRPHERCFIIPDTKAKLDARIPLSAAIARELKRARDHGIEGNPFVFPARAGSHIAKFNVDGLPVYGKMLRHVWRTVAADCGIDELICDFCQGHIPPGISRGYVQKLMLSNGDAMRAAQRKVSRRMISLLGGGKI